MSTTSSILHPAIQSVEASNKMDGLLFHRLDARPKKVSVIETDT